MHPPADTTVSVGDVVVVGYQDDIPELATRWSPTSKRAEISYRGVAADTPT